MLNRHRMVYLLLIFTAVFLWGVVSNFGYAAGKRIGVVLLTREHHFFNELVDGVEQ